MLSVKLVIKKNIHFSLFSVLFSFNLNNVKSAVTVINASQIARKASLHTSQLKVAVMVVSVTAIRLRSIIVRIVVV